LLTKPENDKSLTIESIQIDKQVYSSKDAYADIGNKFELSTFTDWKTSKYYDTLNHLKEIKVLKDPGAVRFYPISIDSAIFLSNRELEEIPEGPSLYRDGTLVQRNDGDPLFVIYQNMRFFIDNNPLTLKLYGLDEKPINKIGDLIYEIPEGGELPQYPEKTIIKSPDNTLYLIADNKRYTIPDEETKEIMGLSSIKERLINIKVESLNYADAIIQLRIDNKPINEWYVQNTYGNPESTNHKVKVPLSDGEHSLDIILLKKGSAKPQIEKIEVDGKEYLPSEAIYDKGKEFDPSSSIDGKDTAAGENLLLEPGALGLR